MDLAGFNYYGNECMYSGITGREFEAEIFIGPVYYQQLRHMVQVSKLQCMFIYMSVLLSMLVTSSDCTEALSSSTDCICVSLIVCNTFLFSRYSHVLGAFLSITE